MWLGTEEGRLFILDAINKNSLIDRQLTATPGQGIVAIYHQLIMRYVPMYLYISCGMHFVIEIWEGTQRACKI